MRSLPTRPPFPAGVSGIDVEHESVGETAGGDAGADNLPSVVDTLGLRERQPARISRQQIVQVGHGAVTVEKGMVRSPGRLRRTDYLAEIVDAVRMAVCAPQRTQVGHHAAAVKERVNLIRG